MNLKIDIKRLAIEAICLLYMSLLVYAAASKWLEFESFQAQLGQSPVLSSYTGILSYAVIAVEVLIALLLALPATRLSGLYAAFELMVFFTLYIIIILNFSDTIPCSCGGVLENLGWKEHLAFNVFFVLLALAAILLISRNHKKTMLRIALLTLSASAVLALLYWRSEKIMHQENPFIRRFTPGSSQKTAEATLHNTSLYFAGSDPDAVYLADQRAPLHIFKYDLALKTKKHYQIELDNTDFRFRSVQVKIVPPYFFVMDGTVPVIYRGKTSDWKAKVLMKDSGAYFSKAVIIDSSKVAFRTQQKQSAENILGLFSFENGLQSRLYAGLLKKQIDGLFDTDGMMHFDTQGSTLVYLYYYRNQFIVTDSRLQLKYRGNTIDTTSTARIKPVYIKEKRQRKLSSADPPVNRLSTLNHHYLFIASSLLGRYEPREMWDSASIVDLYDISSKSYVSSIYVYDEGSSKMKDMISVGNNLYVLAGKKLQRYELYKELRQARPKSIPAGSRGNDRKPVQ